MAIGANFSQLMLKFFLLLALWIILLTGAINVRSGTYGNLVDLLAPYNVALISLGSIIVNFLGCNKALNYAILVITVFTFGILIEAVGVATGLPFGVYQYSDILGPKILEVPLVIGLSWVSVVSLSYILAGACSKNKVARIFLGSILVMCFDVCLEPAAIALGYWSWEETCPPLINYLAWGGITALFHTVAVRLLDEFMDFVKVRYYALNLFCAQQVFFILVG